VVIGEPGCFFACNSDTVAQQSRNWQERFRRTAADRLAEGRHANPRQLTGSAAMCRIRFVLFAILLGFCTAADVASADEAEAWTALHAGRLTQCAIPADPKNETNDNEHTLRPVRRCVRHLDDSPVKRASSILLAT
jgi:hypothetical protein